MEIKQVTFSYDGRVNQLKDVSGVIEKNKITTIIGPNGCGKSTLLGIMSQNYAPNYGQVVLDGKAVAAYKPKDLAKKLAVVHQHNTAPADMTVEKLASYGRLPHKSLLRQEGEDDDKVIEWALACTNLLDKRHKRLAELSGGERQRVWIAMALAQQTPILFLDEPTTYLDIYHQIELLELIKSLNMKLGLTIVMVLHDINQAIRYSDNVIVMKNGEILAIGKPGEVITADVIRTVYGVNVAVKQGEDTGMYIVPLGYGG